MSDSEVRDPEEGRITPESGEEQSNIEESIEAGTEIEETAGEEDTALEEAAVEDDSSLEEAKIKKVASSVKKKSTVSRTKRKPIGKKWIGAGVALAAIVILAILLTVQHNRAEQLRREQGEETAKVNEEMMEILEDVRHEHQKDAAIQNPGEDVIRALIDAGIETKRGIDNRPPYVELTDANRDHFTTIESCKIDKETGQVVVTVSAKELPISDDGYYYLFSEAMYEHGIGTEPITKAEKDVDFDLICNLNYNSPSSRLFDKFVVAVKQGGEYRTVSGTHYITNPEAIARFAPSFGTTNSKKGLLVDPAYLNSGQLEDLGVKHAAYNIPLSRILGGTTNGFYPTIGYSYNGKSYSFNGHVIDEYDTVFSALTNKGITVTAIILNDMSAYSGSLIHPQASGGGRSHYYAFNNTNRDGIDAMAAVGSFLANRYSGNGHGKVMNWVIGNEVNVRMDWNYLAYTDVGTYSDIYADSIRVFYNAIKSVNANARVYISIDQQWDRNRSNSDAYDARDVVDEVARYISSEGNIDWSVAQHPYNYPLTAVRSWNMGKYENLITNSADTSIIAVKNIHVLTDYLQRDEMLGPDGNVRHVILSEVGYTSTGGQELQAAAFAYAYKVIEANQYIDSILLNRQTDHSVETAQGLALGLNSVGGGRKFIYNVFKYIDTPQAAAYCDFALNYVGAGSWSDVIKKR